MNQLLAYLLPALVAAAILGVFLKMSMPKRNAVSIKSRLTQFAERPSTLEELELQQPFVERVVKPILTGITRALGKLTPAAGMEKTRQQIVLAGSPYNMGTSEFTAARIMAMVVLAGVAFGIAVLFGASPLNMLLYAGVLGLIGFVLPSFWLGTPCQGAQEDYSQDPPGRY